MPFQVQKSAGIVLLIIFAIVLAAGYVVYSIREKAEREESALAQIQVGDALPYTDLDGNVFDLERYRGTVLVVNTWASWSPFSADELPLLARLKNEYGDRLAVVAINRMEPQATAAAFISHIGNLEGITFLLDPDDTFYKTIGGFAMPETVVYDQKGNEVSHRRGALMYADMQSLVNTALAPQK